MKAPYLRLSPFKGLTYNSKKISSFEDVLTPPYDVISSEEKQVFWKKSPYNFTHIDLGESYVKIGETFKTWTDDEILISSHEVSFYFCKESFNFNGKHERYGLISLVNIGSHIIPHEKTFLKYREDRLEVTKATGTQLSPIFGMFSHEENLLKNHYEKSLQRIQPFIHFKEGTYTFEMWCVTDQKFFHELNEKLKNNKIYIIDGHHRYAVAEEYNKLIGSNNSQVMMYLVNQTEGGLLVLPTHRAICHPEACRQGRQYEGSRTDGFFAFALNDSGGQVLPLLKGLSQLKNSSTHIGVTYRENPDKLHVLDPKEFSQYSPPAHLRWLEAKLSQSKIEKIHYIRGLPSHEKAALEDLKNGKFDVIFWVSPVSWDEFFKVTESGEVMPQKSTYFFPKILSGPVLYRF